MVKKLNYDELISNINNNEPFENANSFSEKLNNWWSGFNFSNRDLVIAGSSIASTLILVIALTSFTGINFSLTSKSNTSAASALNTTGEVALTEEQLRASVKELGTPVYWAGPMAGAKYTLTSQDGSQVYIRYLPDGKVPSTNTASFRVIATYKLTDAFASTQKAGESTANGLGLTNGDGAAIYYNKDRPTNVYMAYPNKDQQVEVFDPNSGVALQLATTPGTITLVS